MGSIFFRAMTIGGFGITLAVVKFRRVTVIGLGLLGGSLCLALRRLINPPVVVGYAHRNVTLLRAREMDLADEFTGDLVTAVKGADLVVLATPVGTFESVLGAIAPHLGAGTIVTDVGSTKRTVCRLAGNLLPKTVHFVGSHPMAGGERSGPDNAREDLFVHAPVIVTPFVLPMRASTGSAAAAAADRLGPATTAVAELWEALHARVTFLDADTHDRLVASVSHLPHATASMLVTVQSLPALELSGAGYRDATRVAAGDPDLWRDILMDNRDYVADALKRLRTETDELIRMLDSGDASGIREYLAGAAMKRGAPIRERPPMV